MTQFRITSWLIFTIMMLTGCNLSITNESVVRKDGAWMKIFKNLNWRWPRNCFSLQQKLTWPINKHGFQ